MSDDERQYVFFDEAGPITLTESGLCDRYMKMREALAGLVAAVDEYEGPYPDREQEVAALEKAREALR